MTIHAGHPFPTPPDPMRRFRGRVGGTVSLWTAGSGADRAGLTVTSFLLAQGEPAHLVAAIDPDSDLRDALEETGRGVVALLGWGDRYLAEAFAQTAPAPGGPFRQAGFTQTEHGPVLSHATAYALVSLREAHDLGWSLLVTCRVDEVEVDEETQPALGHRRGRFGPLGEVS